LKVITVLSFADLVVDGRCYRNEVNTIRDVTVASKTH
jgi:hypothetical protein